MRLDYKGKTYELTELYEPNVGESFDIIAVFRVKYCIWKGTELIEVSKDEFDRTFDRFEDLEYVGYFYGSEDDIESKAIEKIDGGNGNEC